MSNNQRKALWAALAVVLSSLMWMYVNFVEDVEYSDVIRAVPIVFVGEDILNARNLRVIENITGTVTLTIDGPRSDVSKLSNSNVTVEVDLSTIYNRGTPRLAYDVKMPDTRSGAVRVTNSSTRYIDLFIDAIESKPIEVRAVTNIKAAEGFIVDNPILDPSEIRIEGPSTIIDLIEYAEVTFNRENVNHTITLPLAYRFMDAGGDEVPYENVAADYHEVLVTVPVSVAQNVALDVDFRDGGGITFADNIRYSIKPEIIRIKGAPSDLEGVNIISLGIIDLARLEAAGGKEDREFKIVLPNGCASLSGEETAVVTVEVTGAKSVFVSTTNIELLNAEIPSGYKIESATNAVSALIRGPESIIGQVTSENIRIAVDLTGQTLNPGLTMYPATVLIDGISGVGAVGEYSVAVEITGIAR
jgi:YbbR domain-containing protein